MTNIKRWNIRTGEHEYPVVTMPDGRQRAVWRVFDGPRFVGVFTQEMGGEIEPTTEADYAAYCMKLRENRS